MWEHARGRGYDVSACVPLTWWAGCLPQRAHTHTQHVRQEWTGSSRCHHHDSPPESQDYPKRRKHQQMIPSRTTECLPHHSSNIWITKKDNSGSSSSTTAVWTIAVPIGIGQLNPHSILTCNSRTLSVEVQSLRFTKHLAIESILQHYDDQLMCLPSTVKHQAPPQPPSKEKESVLQVEVQIKALSNVTHSVQPGSEWSSQHSVHWAQNCWRKIQPVPLHSQTCRG